MPPRITLKMADEPAESQVVRTVKHSPDIARVVRIELERIAQLIERKHVNVAYKSAFKLCAKIIRDRKPD